MPKSHKQSVIERLREDPAYAVEYVNAALEDGDESGFLKALRNVAEAKKMSKVAAEAAVERESLYRMLSEHGNPRYTSLVGVLGALGLQFRIQSSHSQIAENVADIPYFSWTSPLLWEIADRPKCFFESFNNYVFAFPEVDVNAATKEAPAPFPVSGPELLAMAA